MTKLAAASEMTSTSSPESCESPSTDGLRCALGFECPVYIPAAEDSRQVGMARLGEPVSFASSLGASVLVCGLQEMLYIFQRLVGDSGITLTVGYEPELLEFAGPALLLWEACITGAAAKDAANKLMESCSALHSNNHLADALLAVQAFIARLPRLGSDFSPHAGARDGLPLCESFNLVWQCGTSLRTQRRLASHFGRTAGHQDLGVSCAAPCDVQGAQLARPHPVDTSDLLPKVAPWLASSPSSDFVEAAEAERDLLAVRLNEAQERLEHFETLAAEAREEAQTLADSIRAIEEVAGLAPQLALCEISEELRGERLREVALEVLQRLATTGDPVHYRAWFEALVEAGYRVSGRDPLATFLTQITRIDRVESVGRRSGLYRLRLAA